MNTQTIATFDLMDEVTLAGVEGGSDNDMNRLAYKFGHWIRDTADAAGHWFCNTTHFC